MASITSLDRAGAAEALAACSAVTKREIAAMLAELYPICRSLTGDGVRRTLSVIGRSVDLTIHEVPSGTRVFDWTVPKEWNIRDAYIKDASGRRIVDFRKSNLHVVSYSIPVRARVSRNELATHVFTLPAHPDWVPYRTCYYNEDWGFCVSHRQWLQMTEPEYEVCIDSSLEHGSLTYGEAVIQGERPQEILISCHICHPSLANDNLSGVVVATLLARHLRALRLRYSYRFLFVPGTIGSLAWLSSNEHRLARLRGGLVLAGLGDPGGFTYKRSRHGQSEIDRAATKALRDSGAQHTVIDFSPYGYDERQFCSPGFDLPVGCLMRTPHGRYPEYHTSADDLSFVKPEQIAASLFICMEIIGVLEANRVFVNLSPKGEPQLGKRGLYRAIGGDAEGREREGALLWTLNLADGRNDMLDIAERSGLPFAAVAAAAETLARHRLLKELS
ncbi:MAG TPA: DUF4910 domain-containing protein [Candidatus Eisenbacteria bacterium]|nr:DUF4910 domain-containing protein [Candidatus Eisenbacteria bacterium]